MRKPLSALLLIAGMAASAWASSDQAAPELRGDWKAQLQSIPAPATPRPIKAPKTNASDPDTASYEGKGFDDQSYAQTAMSSVEGNFRSAGFEIVSDKISCQGRWIFRDCSFQIGYRVHGTKPGFSVARIKRDEYRTNRTNHSMQADIEYFQKKGNVILYASSGSDWPRVGKECSSEDACSKRKDVIIHTFTIDYLTPDEGRHSEFTQTRGPFGTQEAAQSALDATIAQLKSKGSEIIESSVSPDALDPSSYGFKIEFR